MKAGRKTVKGSHGKINKKWNKIVKRVNGFFTLAFVAAGLLAVYFEVKERQDAFRD